MRRCIRDVHTYLRSVLPPVQFEQIMPGVCHGLRQVLTSRGGGGFQPGLHFLHGWCEVMDPCDEAGFLGWVVTVLDEGQMDIWLLLGHDLFYDTSDVLWGKRGTGQNTWIIYATPTRLSITTYWQTTGYLLPHTWWCHQIETFSAYLAICAGNSLVPGEFPTQWPITRSFDVLFDLRLNKRLSKQSWGWWFQTISFPLWRHHNVYTHRCIYCIHTH